MTIRVLVCDDQSLVRAGFRKLLEADPDLAVVGEAVDGEDAVRQTRATSPDVVLMDIRMPNLDGLAATRRIVDTCGGDPRILILTTFGEDDYVFEALQAGASGFLLKDAPPETLLAAVRVVARGEALLDPAVTRSVIAGYLRSRPREPKRRAENRLTGRELEILRLIATGHSNAEIAEHLVLSEATVKTHVGSILAKLGVRDRVQAVIFAYENGLANSSM
jgi:DNA-binding NarL/FixJ family response regulator